MCHASWSGIYGWVMYEFIWYDMMGCTVGWTVGEVLNYTTSFAIQRAWI